MMQDIRWKQCFSNDLKVLQTLDETSALAQARALSKLKQQSLIQNLKLTHELT